MKRVGVRLLLAVLLLAACTRAEIYYPDNGIPTPATEGYIRIYPDPSKHALPALQYHFYNTNTDVEYTVLPCDGLGNFEGMLPVGTYRVIATNTTATNVVFSDMHSYETATVTANRMETRGGTLPHRMETRSGTLPLAQPGTVYSTVLQNLVVSPADTVRYDPAPALLTRKVTLTFTLMGALADITERLEGKLQGVYPSINLYNCSHTPESVSQSYNMAINFETSEINDNHQCQVEINLFGLADPEYGDAYNNVLTIALTTAGGEVIEVDLDLTDNLSEIIELNGGDIPLDLSLPIEIRQTDVGLGAILTGWIDNGETEVDN